MLDIWVVYFNPRDYPGKYVVRRHTVDSHGVSHVSPKAHLFNHLEDCRQVIPPDKVLLMPMPGDDKSIVQTWI